MKNKVTCVCDLCSMGIPQSKQCYIGVRNCLKNGVYVEFRNREEEFKNNGKSGAKISELTKDECIKSLKELSRIRCLAREEYDREEDAIITIRRLINEHFDNKPYEVEEDK